MTWAWQERYNTALREEDPGKLAERLVAAEKAILQRLQELPDPVDEIPEGRALREALDCLYALSPQEEHPTPGELADEDYDTKRDKRMRIATSCGLALVLLFGWAVARNKARNSAQEREFAAETDRLMNPPPSMIVERLDKPPGGEVSRYGLESALRKTPDSLPIAKNVTPPKTQTSGASLDLRVPADAGRPQDRDAAVEQAALGSAGNDSADGASAGASVEFTTPSNEETSGPPPLALDMHEQSELPRGTVSVSPGTYPSIRVPPELGRDASSAGATLQIGQPISRVDPVYPEEAERQGIEGTVSLRALIGKNGEVQNVEVMNGPALLAAAGVKAIRQWRYQPTLLGDQPIEVAEDVTIVFRLESSTAATR